LQSETAGLDAWGTGGAKTSKSVDGQSEKGRRDDESPGEGVEGGESPEEGTEGGESPGEGAGCDEGPKEGVESGEGPEMGAVGDEGPAEGVEGGESPEMGAGGDESPEEGVVSGEGPEKGAGGSPLTVEIGSPEEVWSCRIESWRLRVGRTCGWVKPSCRKERAMEVQSIRGLVARNHGRPNTSEVEEWSFVTRNERVCEVLSRKVIVKSRNLVIKPPEVGWPSKSESEMG